MPLPSCVAFVAVAELPVQEPEEPETLPVTLPFKLPTNFVPVTVPSFATAYTYAIFLFPVILSAYLISKSLTFAVVVVLSVSFVYFS